MTPRYATVVFDVDSTLCGLEGVDWLAARNVPELAAEFADLSRRAMEGELPLEAIYAARLERIVPTEADIVALTERYLETVAEGAVEVIAAFREAGVRVYLVSGGLRNAIWPVGERLGFAADEVRAVRVTFDGAGRYRDFERSSPLVTKEGKIDVVQSLGAPAPLLMVGDGSTDAAVGGMAGDFALFTGFVLREPLVGRGQYQCRSFAEVKRIVLEG